MSANRGTARWRRPARLIARAACAWTVICIAGSVVGTSAATKPPIRTVVIDGVKFEPEALTVQRGDTVVWVNKDPFPHTVTAPGAFDSHSIAAGRSWKYVARKAGDYSYTCTLHPNMKGSLKVE